MATLRRNTRSKPRSNKAHAPIGTRRSLTTRTAAAAAPTISPAALPPIQCIVVLMLENRSFDHLFGKWPGVSGLADGPFSNRQNPSAPATPTGNQAIAEGQPALFSVAQGQGPGHALDDTNVQLFATKVVPAGAMPKPPNDRGFVQNYLTELGVDGFAGAGADLTPVMQTFTAAQLPGLAALAQNFVLCDQWYAEVPGPTMPNRLFMHAATSAGWARNDWSLPLAQVTIYEQMQNSGRNWAVYYSDQNEVAQYSRINTEPANFKLYESGFSADAAAGKLANYNFIIPRFAGSATDGPVTSMHAPQDVRPADQLVADIYAALRASPQWSEMLLVVTFDEHGGYFDHADPPAAVNPDGINSPAPGDTASFAPPFAFDRMGVRVPAILASPYLPKGVVCSTQLQHTSVLVTARKLFGIEGSLTKRDAAAPSFESLFLATARSDAPSTLARRSVKAPRFKAPRFDATRAAPDDVMSEMAEHWRRATGGLPGAASAIMKPTTQDEVHRFLRTQIQAFLDHRASRGTTNHGGSRVMSVKTIKHPTDKRTFKLGRNRPIARGPRFSLHNYLMRGIAAPPPTCDYTKPAAAALSNIYENDTLGDCVIAGIGHVVGVLTGNAGDLFVYTNAQITALYSAIGGYVPGDPSTDKGCDEVTALNYWENNGAPVGSNKIAGWLSVNAADPSEYRTALWLFENLYFGFELPDAWINPMPSASGFTWDAAGKSDPNNGHCFVGVGYNAQGITIDTWGMTGLLTDKAIAKYGSSASHGEVYTVVSLDGINSATQKAPNGFDWSQLIADFDSMGGSVSPPPAVASR
ncbi:MAG: alkaline phosphatase family protein [Steroidobacteraceae bacterium]